jgi:hypothetical protein
MCNEPTRDPLTLPVTTERTVEKTKGILRDSFSTLDEMHNYLHRLMDGCEVDDNKIYNVLERSEVLLHVLTKEQLYYDWEPEK